MKISFVQSALAVGIALTLALASCAAAETPKKEETPAPVTYPQPNLLKIFVQRDGGDYHGSYGKLEVSSGFGSGKTVGGDSTGGSAGVDIYRFQVEYPTTVAKGTKVVFTLKGIKLTATGTTTPAVIPATNKGGLSFSVSGPNSLPATVVDNGDGSYTVTAQVDDYTDWGGTASQVNVTWKISATTVDVTSYSGQATF